MRIAIYSAPSYLDTTIPLVNELSGEHSVALVIEHFPRVKTSICETGELGFPGLLATGRNDVGRYLGGSVMSAIDDRIDIAVLRYRSLKYYNPVRYRSTASLIDFLRRTKVDVVDMHALHALPALLFLTGMTKVVTLHDPLEHMGEKGGRGTGLVKSITLRSADGIITHDDHSRKMMLDKFHIPEQRSRTVYLGALDIFRKWQKKSTPEEPDTVLFFGRISSYKGIEYLIESAEMAQKVHPGLKVIIAGSGDFARYRGSIRNSGMFEIHNHYIGNEEASDLFQRASCVILPYTDASQSGVLMTAYAFNKPVIVTEVGGLPEVVDDGITGYVVPPRNSKAIADAIVKMLSDKQLAARMKDKIRDDCARRFSWRHIARLTADAYDSFRTLKARS